MIQETLYSLAQNGSLLGLTNLLVLVLVVINRSMAAIHFIGQIFNTLKSRRQEVQCNEISSMLSDYNVFGDLCDQILPFHNFGVYLLRGHTLFTLTFLVIALVIFIVTVCYHRNVRRQNNVLNEEIRECKPQRRREMLFNTLLLSICAYFISIAGQSFVEIAVFWAENREDATEWARWFQLARIAAFVDPLFNPLLVTLRIPAMNAKLQWIGRCISNMTLLICCRKRVRKGRSKQKRILASTTGMSSTSPHTVHSDDFFSKLLCHRNLRSKFSSSYRRSHSGTVSIAKLSSTAINISPKNITKLVLSNISLSSTISEGCTYPETFTDERTQKDSGTDNCISKNTQSKNKNSKKIIQKYYETTSKKVLIFNAFPETFRNRNGSIYSDIIIKWLEYMPSHVMINRVYNFDKMIESIKLIEQEISAIESVCLRKKLNMGDFATNESLQIDDEKSTVMNVSEMLNETLRTLNDLIIDVCKNNSNAES
ncbi:unnamed protein product [Acanthocheilonema viteae]|uniref:Uncharacterized protein n=1 Tax=Acanthocheilonema viteae TaxID=6277 RepID=A0A498SMG3_ACAVI|nr:unnamed protein product [Acanthocheilonema viteae]